MVPRDFDVLIAWGKTILGPGRPTAKRLQVTEHKLTPDEATAEVVAGFADGFVLVGASDAQIAG